MIKILVAIPCLTGAAHCKEAIDSVINKENVDVLICDNGADQDVKDLIETYRGHKGVIIYSNEKNVYVTPVWNQFMRYFLNNTEYSHLIIMNSDLIMNKDWDLVCKEYWKKMCHAVLIPEISNDKAVVSCSHSAYVNSFTEVYEGTPGVFITMNRKQCEIVYPIPQEILVWFNDLWIFTILREFYRTIIPDTLLSFHHWSQTIQKRPEVYEIIEQDKINWEINVVNQMLNKIEQLKNDKL